MENTFCIIDEKGQYVHKHSIKYCDKKWYYSSSPELERGYISIDVAKKAKENLELQNKLSGMKHTFKIVPENENLLFVIKDEETNGYLSSRSFWSMDGISWDYFTYTGKLGTIFHKCLKTAEEALSELFDLNSKSGFNRKLVIDVVNVDSLPIGQTIKALQ